jgi:hypothetical protein
VAVVMTIAPAVAVQEVLFMTAAQLPAQLIP